MASSDLPLTAHQPERTSRAPPPTEDDIRRLLSRNRLQEAVSAFHACARHRRTPHYSVCNSLLAACEASQWFPGAWAVFTAAHQGGVRLSYNTYGALIRLCLSVSEGERAIEVFRALQDSGFSPNKVTYSMLISGLLRIGRGGQHHRAAHQLWTELASSGTPLDGTALRVGLNCCVEVGDREGAAHVGTLLQQAGHGDDVHAWNIRLKRQHGGSRAGAEAPSAALHRMAAAGVAPDAVTYNTLVAKLVAAGELIEARAMLHEAAQAGCASSRGYTTLLKGEVAAGGAAAGEVVLREMRHRGLPPSCVTYMLLVLAYLREERFEEAEGLFQHMLDCGVQPNTQAYNVMLKGAVAQALGGYCDTPHLTHSITQLLAQMKAAGVPLQRDTFNTVIAGMMQVGENTAAIRLWRKMTAMGYHPDALTVTTIMTALERVGDTQAAVELFSSLPADSLDVVAWNAFVAVQAKAGNMEAALDALGKGEQLAVQRGEPLPVEAYDAVIKAYGRKDDVEQVVSCLRSFLRAGGVPDQRMFEHVVFVCVKNSAFKRVMQVIRAMELTDTTIDKERYQYIIDKADQARDQWRQQQQRQRQNAQRQQLEKFKFWLGLPNELYNSDWP